MRRLRLPSSAISLITTTTKAPASGASHTLAHCQNKEYSVDVPALEYFATLRVEVDAPIEAGQIDAGLRRVIPITGGEIKGTDWQGRVLSAGADFQLIATARRAELDARYIVELDSGERIFIQNRAVRVASPEVTQKLIDGVAVDPSEIYFRCTPVFETASERFQWITERVFVGTGIRRPDCVELTIFAVS
ncbi:MAG: hypothetical protein CMI01_15290 [Oceanospirillaceae bacterium]|nr:hypothetical protein [Oceanospirillaceae bacterium]